MKFDISSFKVTGSPGPSGWVQVHEFEPENEEKNLARGRLFLVISTPKFEEGVEGVVLGRELISRFQEEYFGDILPKPFDALKKATEKVAGEFLPSLGKVEIAACSLVGDIIYSAAIGGGNVVVLRDGMLASILESGETAVCASGYPKDGDTLLAGTKSFFVNSSPGVIKASLENKNLEDCSEAFSSLVRSRDDSGSMGAIVIRFGKSQALAEKIPVFNNVPGRKMLSQRGANFGYKIRNFFSGLKRVFPERRIYIRQSVNELSYSKNKRITLSVGVMLLVILAISIGFGIRQRNIKKLESRYIEKLQQANHNLDEAVGLSGVDTASARELFSRSDQAFKEISQIGAKDERIDELGRRLEEERGKILGEYKASPELFVDLSLLSSGFKAEDYASSGDVVYILDKSGKKVVSVDIDGKKSKVAASRENVDGALDLAAYEGRIFLLFSDGVYEIDNGKKKVIEKTWNGEAFFAAYTGNLYVLDKNGNSIYRHSGGGTSFGSGQSWLAPGTKADFSNAKSFVIDGAVYVVFPGGRILKYSLGAPQAFSVSGEFPEISQADALYSNDECQYLYILDRKDKRILVTDKNGEYKAQYTSEDLGGAFGITASEKHKKIIILTPDKLLSIEMKHL